MEQEQELAVEQAPASETPTPATPSEAPAASPGAAPSEAKPDPKDRQAVIKEAFRKSEAARKNAAGREIDDKGRFVPKKETTQAPAPATGGAVPSGAAASPAPTEQKAIPAPAGLTVAMKARWAQLPPEVQAELARLDRTAAEAAGKAAQPYAEKAKAHEEMQAVIAPYLPMIQAEGGTPARAVASLLQTAALLRTGSPQQKTNAVLQMCQQFGVQLPQGTVDQQAQAMPDITAHPYVQQLAGRLEQVHGYLTQQQQAEQQRLQESNAKAVQDFMGDVDAKGQPKFPLEPSMEPGFAAEIQITKSLHPDWDARRVLEAAYENLSWKEPALRQLRLQKQEEERRAKEQADLAAKKAAAVSVKGSGPASAPASVDPKDRRSLIASRLGAVRS